MKTTGLDKKHCIVGMGELVWDIFPDGKRLGGAPSNFTYHAQQLGANSVDCFIASSIGEDTMGHEISEHLKTLGLSQEHIQKDPLHNTGTVDVFFDATQMPDYTISKNAAWDFIPLQPKSLATRCDAFCFGSLAQREPVSRASIYDFLNNMSASALRIFDINLRQDYFTNEILITSLNHANVFKINDEELKELAKIVNIQGSEEAIVQQLRQDYQFQLVILTRGEKGSLLVTDSEIDDHPGFPVSVIDTVGAGDSFTAATAIGLLQKLPIQQLNHIANRVAAFVCTQAGATPVLPTDILSYFSKRTHF